MRFSDFLLLQLVLLLSTTIKTSNAFLPRLLNHRESLIERQDGLRDNKLPTLEQLSEDPFMQQVQYGSQLSGALLDKPIGLSDDELKELLQAQLSHSNGIRGFMVSYLTSDDETEDSFHVPNVLVEALKEQVKSCPDELVPLTFMNVIMPTAMSTMHEQEELKQSSARTAKRGLCVLESLAGETPLLEDNAQAILAVATDDLDQGGEESSLIKYWTDFFEKWGYEEEQKNDISQSMESFLQKV